jgi:NADH:ubiquinone oxidoreductase subunit 5 (subunit L)/multisubunit Na+/H+ antiporter MnhA subunit
VGWEGVGLCSYLLISFWWDRVDKDGGMRTHGTKYGSKASAGDALIRPRQSRLNALKWAVADH